MKMKGRREEMKSKQQLRKKENREGTKSKQKMRMHRLFEHMSLN